MKKKTYTPTELLAMPRSQLLRLAVFDMRAARKRGFKLDMETWFEPKDGKKPCTVCMAGAVLACHLSKEDQNYIAGEHIEGEHSEKLWDLLDVVNDMRTGYIPMTSEYDYNNEKTEKARAAAGAVINVSYCNDRDGGRATEAAYLKAAKILEEAGL